MKPTTNKFHKKTTNLFFVDEELGEEDQQILEDSAAFAAGLAAMHEEIKNQIVEYDRTNEINIDALMLMQLRVQLGFGKKRLKRFYDSFAPAYDQMINDYMSRDGDAEDPAIDCLKEIGVDIRQWHLEKNKDGE